MMSLAAALKSIRKSRQLSQECFSDVSSRTYLSTLERGLKSPTISKIEEICQVMGVHPLTLMTLAYAGSTEAEIDELQQRVRNELKTLTSN